MDEVVTDENCALALAAVKRNKGAAGIDRMTTKELESHLQVHGEKIRAKLLAGTYVPSPIYEEGRNTQTKRRHEDAGDSDGTGSVHPKKSS